MTISQNRVKNILVVGTGGQGVVTASEILAEVAMLSGFDTKKSEIHGMSQRGGVVSSHVRFGKTVFSPLIQEGDADILLSFELSETVRWLSFISKKGQVITSRRKIVPPIVSTGTAAYPDNAEAIIRQNTASPIIVDALPIAEELGNPRLINTILLGISSTLLPLPVETWKTVIAKQVPAKYKDLNMDAFDKGRSLA